MIKKTEKEIIEKWEHKTKKPTVSILCIAYNQELYIENTICSFLTQETNFSFEIVIGEDCSTDGTREIIEKYKEKYPNIIKLIIRKNNIGMMKNFLETMSHCSGEFIAICEGDDYWIEPKKLQIQYGAMLEHENIDLCFTNVITLDLARNKSYSYFNPEDTKKIYTLSESIRKGGGFAPTCTFFLRRNIIDNLPSWFKKYAPVGDYYLQILGALRGGALYLPQKTGTYRINTIGSWTQNRKVLSREKIEKEVKLHEICLNELAKTVNDKSDFNFSKSTIYYNATLESINSGHKQDIKKYIEKSWKFYPNLKHKQKKIYLLRNFSNLLYFYYAFKKLIKTEY